MADLVRWSGHGGIAFYIKSNEMRGVDDLQISASADTENATSGGEKYTKKKNAGGYEIGITASLNAGLGVDVRAVSLDIAEAARLGDAGYFYCGETKLFPASFMMTNAQVESIRMTPTGTWISCEVNMTLKQCGKYDGSGTAASTGTKKATSNTKSLKTTTGTTTVIDKAKEALSTVQKAKEASAKAYQNLTSKQKKYAATSDGLVLSKANINSKISVARR